MSNLPRASKLNINIKKAKEFDYVPTVKYLYLNFILFVNYKRLFKILLDKRAKQKYMDYGTTTI